MTWHGNTPVGKRVVDLNISAELHLEWDTYIRTLSQGGLCTGVAEDHITWAGSLNSKGAVVTDIYQDLICTSRGLQVCWFKQGVFQFFKLPYKNFSHIQEYYSWWLERGDNNKAVPFYTIWEIWKARNALIF